MKRIIFLFVALTMLACGSSALAQDNNESIKLLKELAQSGDAYAQGLLGYCYEVGEDVPQSYTEAVKWYRKAAEQGDDLGQFSLGDCYARGMNQPKRA